MCSKRKKINFTKRMCCSIKKRAIYNVNDLSNSKTILTSFSINDTSNKWLPWKRKHVTINVLTKMFLVSASSVRMTKVM